MAIYPAFIALYPCVERLPDILAGKLVEPKSKRVYTTGMIEKAHSLGASLCSRNSASESIELPQ